MVIKVSFLSGLILFAAHLNALPLSSESSDSSISSEENGVVYVLNIYAVKNMKVETVKKMFTVKPLEKMPQMFESIGSIIMDDEDGDEPVNMGEIAGFLEEFGIITEKVNEGDEIKVIQVKLDNFDNDEFYTISMAEIMSYLEAEGISVRIYQEDNVKVLQIEFNESIKDPRDQSFSLKDLADYFENEGFNVEVIKHYDTVKAIRIKIDNQSDDDENNNGNDGQDDKTAIMDKNDDIEKKLVEEKQRNKNTNSIDSDYEKKKNHNNDDSQFVLYDYVTKTEAMNKIRRRRSVCPECKAASMIKEFIAKNN